jgi:hypothetical protein
LVKLAALNTGAALNVGATVEPVKLPKTVLAAAVERENVKAGVVVAVATEVVNRGDRASALKLVTVPLPPLGVKHPVALPLARIPIAATPAPQLVGVAVRAAAVPVVF